MTIVEQNKEEQKYLSSIKNKIIQAYITANYLNNEENKLFIQNAINDLVVYLNNEIN
jgi:hypothetical protein